MAVGLNRYEIGQVAEPSFFEGLLVCFLYCVRCEVSKALLNIIIGDTVIEEKGYEVTQASKN